MAVALMMGMAAQPGDVRAQDASGREDQLKAAYLFNFVKFVEWPPTAGQALTVCFVGGQGVRDALAKAAQNRTVGTRSLAVRSMAPAEKSAGCNVLYLEAASSAADLHGSEGLPVLTVSDRKAFTREGGMIELFTENNRLRFNINVDTAHKAGLRISSSLLQLAAAVEKGDGK